ncbi:non-ribosomal peptide synthetase [Algibacter mikhailovii]|uniref:non-ribosomal peptide synthetase n=1 Tax=Algibacter mikhailovii TaxID=425498 RepID=UPI0024949A0D|nr:amino acid adenylation domain-containing protein [Algibacter mikhailovii]
MKKETEKSDLLSRWKNRDKKRQLSISIEKAPMDVNIPLSHGQKRLWILQQLHPKNPFYNYSETYTINGDLNANLLVECLKRIYNDHDILRTTYYVENREVFQKIDNQSEIVISLQDLSSLSSEDSKNQRQKIIETNANTYFELTKSPLIRASLIKTNPTTHILQITLHHIVTDKWSMQIFRKELAGYYKDLSTKNDAPQRRNEIQYTDYAFWQSKNEINIDSLNYWKKKLSGNIPLLNLPSDYTRGLQPTFKGAASYTQTFNKKLSNKLLSLSQALETTPYVLLLSAYYIFLFRYSGQQDILIGSPITNRDQKVLENLIGFFNETVVLRTNISLDMSVKDLVNEVRKNTLEAFENKNVPFDVLVKELKIERSLAVNPFFQVMFLYHSVTENPPFGDNISLTHNWFDTKVSKFDLTLYIAEEKGILSSTFEYASDLFHVSTINRFQAYFLLLLEGIVSNPNQNIGEIPMLPEPEMHFLLNQERERSNVFSGYDGIHNIIEDIYFSNPNRIAVTYRNASITYKELNDKANVLANHLLKSEKKPNELIGLCMDRSIDVIIAMLAILKSGCAYLPIDPEYPEERINYMIADAQVGTIVTQSNYSGLFEKNNIQQVIMNEIPQSNEINNLSLPNTKGANLAYVIYTSGSTGKPKGVPISHKNIIHSTAGRLTFYEENPSAFLLMSSISFDSSKAGIFWTLCTGGNLVIAEKRIEQDMEKIGHLINDLKISHTLMLPSLYSLILDYVDYDTLNNLKTVIVAGETCPIGLCEKHLNNFSGIGLYNEYGPTEATVWCIAHKISINDIKDDSVPIGKPVANAKIYILDENQQLTPIGVPGELYIGGSGLSEGYLNSEDLTQKVFLTNPHNPKERLYRTGDLAKYKNDGNILFLGRVDEQIKIRGYRVELNEIENTIKSYHEKINEAVVIYEETGQNEPLEFNNLSDESIITLLKNMDEKDFNVLMTSIESLSESEKDYLLNQIEV